MKSKIGNAKILSRKKGKFRSQERAFSEKTFGQNVARKVAYSGQQIYCG